MVVLIWPIYSFGNMRIDDPIDNDAESDLNIHMGNQRLCRNMVPQIQ